MIKLIDGLGILGRQLKKEIKRWNIHEDKDLIIYHTWNVRDKSESAQIVEYLKFCSFISSTKKKIVFISTSSEKNSHYVEYKQRAEAALLVRGNGVIIRFPAFVANNNIFMELRDELKKPEGIIECVTPEDASRFILDDARFDGKSKIYTYHGTMIPATVVKKILDIGGEKG